MKLEDDFHCFACGSLNERGLRIDWRVEGKKTFAEFTPQKEHQGWKGIVHGGIIATLLDEAMTRTAWIVAGGALTAEMTVRYLKTASVGETLSILGEVLEENRRIIQTQSFVFKKKDGTLLARATGKAIKPK